MSAINKKAIYNDRQAFSSHTRTRASLPGHNNVEPAIESSEQKIGDYSEQK